MIYNDGLTCSEIGKTPLLRPNNEVIFNAVEDDQHAMLSSGIICIIINKLIVRKSLTNVSAFYLNIVSLTCFLIMNDYRLYHFSPFIYVDENINVINRLDLTISFFLETDQNPGKLLSV